MLLRWLVNNYLRDAAQEKVREVVADVFTERQPRKPPEQAPAGRVSAAAADQGEADTGDEFIPCDVVFLFALAI